MEWGERPRRSHADRARFLDGFYMGSRSAEESAGMSRLYRWIFTQLTSVGCGRICSFPRIHPIDPRPIVETRSDGLIPRRDASR